MSMNQAGFAPVLEGAPRRWDFLAGLMQSLNLKTFVEVGCKEGRTTGHILKTVPDARVVAIDPWCTWPDQATVKDGETYEKWDFAAIETEFWKNVGENESRCDMVRFTSEDAAAMAETSLSFAFPADIVFIDAAHDYQSVKDDIKRWYPLVKEHGVLAGHDFNHKWPGVQRAIAESFDLMQIGIGPDSVWFILKQEGMNNVRE